MFTPIEDLDIIFVLPYLSLHDVHQILLVQKRLPIEYKQKLDSYKMSTLCDMSFHSHIPSNSITFIAAINNGGNLLDYHKTLKPIQNIKLKRDVNNIPYLRIVYPDKVHTHIIYNSKIKIEKNSILLYTK